MKALVLSACLLILLAGCAGPNPGSGLDESESSDVPREPTAKAPIVDAETGSITGRLLDEELVPIGGGRVAVVQTQELAVVAGDGSFTFNGLAPGKYSLIAEALGYQSASRGVEVVAGAVQGINFTLAPIPLAVEPYLLVIPKTSHIQAEQGFVAQMMENVAAVNISQARALMCGSCLHVLYLDVAPAAALTENVWATSATNTEMETRYMWNRTCGQTCNLGAAFQWGRLTNRQPMAWSEANIKSLAEKHVKMMHVTVTASQFGVSVDHKIETWTTFAYGDPLPEGYSALPPP